MNHNTAYTGKSTVYVGMDVHKNSFTLCCYTMESDKITYKQKIDPDYKSVLKYLESMRKVSGDDAEFLCGYEAGCLGFTLYHQLTNHNSRCAILAPTTMLVAKGKR